MYRVVAAEWRMKWLMSQRACVRCDACVRLASRRADTAQGSAIFWATAASFALRRPYFLVWPRYRPSICRSYRLPLGIRPARVSSLRAELSQHNTYRWDELTSCRGQSQVGEDEWNGNGHKLLQTIWLWVQKNVIGLQMVVMSTLLKCQLYFHRRYLYVAHLFCQQMNSKLASSELFLLT